MNLESIKGDLINSMEQNTEQDWAQRAKQGEHAVKIVLLRGGEYDVLFIVESFLSFVRA